MPSDARLSRAVAASIPAASTPRSASVSSAVEPTRIGPWEKVPDENASNAERGTVSPSTRGPSHVRKAATCAKSAGGFDTSPMPATGASSFWTAKSCSLGTDARPTVVRSTPSRVTNSSAQASPAARSTEFQGMPLMAITRWNRRRQRSSAASCKAAKEPAEWPPTVTLSGSPPKARLPVLDTTGRRGVTQREEAVGAEAVVDGDEHDSPPGEAVALGPGIRVAAHHHAATVDPDEHRETSIPEVRCVHVEVEVL